MTTYQVVTTCNEKGWKQYGKRMVKTFLYHWPADVHFTLYVEGFTPEIPLKDVRQLPLWQQDFKRRHADNPKHNGVVPDRPYQLLFDAVRFSHKVGAVIEAAECVSNARQHINGSDPKAWHWHTFPDVLIWIDADVVTHSPVSTAFLNDLMEPDKALGWLNRVHKYPECGFVIFNLRHLATPLLMGEWRALYEHDTIFKLQHWTDCHSLEHVIKELEVPWWSLSGRYSNVGHPFINGPLGAVMDHLKGNRKNEGRSRKMDLRQRRHEQYWRNAR